MRLKNACLALHSKHKQLDGTKGIKNIDLDNLNFYISQFVFMILFKLITTLFMLTFCLEFLYMLIHI